MDFSKLSDHGCEGIIGTGFHVIYDEADLAICKKHEKVIFSIDELGKLIRMLTQAESKMLENYRDMSLSEKN